MLPSSGLDPSWQIAINLLHLRGAQWGSDVGAKLLAGGLDAAAAHALQRNIDEPPVSGRQEWLENWFNRFGG